MPETLEISIYGLDELDDEAKEKAREWFRHTAFDDNWYECVYNDFERVCDLLGVSLRTSPVRLFGGGVRSKPYVYFRGFWSQGDGACYDASYRYVKGTSAKVRAYAPQDMILHQIADDLVAVQRRNFYQLHARTAHRGHYYHEYCMTVDVSRDGPTCQDMSADAEEAIKAALRDLARWLYRQLEQEYDHLNSDAAVDESIIANGYTFTELGTFFE